MVNSMILLSSFELEEWFVTLPFMLQLQRGEHVIAAFSANGL